MYQCGYNFNNHKQKNATCSFIFLDKTENNEENCKSNIASY